MLKVALGLAASAYVKDAVVRPRQMGKVARDYCDRVGKPLLFVRCSGIADRILGSPVRAEAVTDRAYPVRVPDKTFGAVFAVGVLERQRRPDLAMREWRRVADRVLVVVPSWFSPHTWLDPTHRWVIDPQLKQAAPLWNDKRRTYLLEVSDTGYGVRPWSPTKKTPSPKSDLRPSARSPRSSQRSRSPSSTSPYGAPLSNLPRLQSPTDHSRPPPGPSSIPVPDLGTDLFESSNSVSHLTVVSAPDSDESW